MKTLRLILVAVLALAVVPQVSAEEAAAPGAPVAAGGKGPSETRPAADKPAAPSGPVLAAGYRGATITLPGDQLLYLKKGDRVDVMVTFDAAMEKDVKETLTATILQNVVVLNVVKPEKVTGAGALELLLNPNEAQYLALSVSQAKNINIALRAPGDTELKPIEMASFRRLIK